MAHHSKDDIDDLDNNPIAQELRRMQSDMQQMDRWPRGMITDQDEGALAMAVGREGGKVLLRFAEPTVWVGMEPNQAIELGRSLIKHARAQQKKPEEYPY